MTAETTSVGEEITQADPIGRPDDHDTKITRLKLAFSQLNGLIRRRIALALLASLAAAAVALAGGLWYFEYRADQDTDAAAAKSAISAATDGTIAVLSYSPDTLERDFASAKSRLTGDFLSYYTRFTEQIVTPAAKQKSVQTSAVVLRAAVTELRPDSAVVLVFVNQSTASKDRPEATLASSSVLVTLTKASGKWLISSFDPV
jgi:Mce-associated membrane protein